jgi:hypothetical protein
MSSADDKTESKLMQMNTGVDFSTINPMAIWEAEKRLFYVAVVDFDLQKEAVDYLVRNRLHYSFQYLLDKCKSMVKDGLVSDYSTATDGNNDLLNVSYNTQWFAPWVCNVKVYWNRIEYMIEEPTEMKHEVFRQSCTSVNAFSNRQSYEVAPGEDFPVENLNVVEDVPAVRHEYEPNSPFGTILLSDSTEDTVLLSIASEPFWIWDDKFIVAKERSDEKPPIFLNEKPRDPSTKTRIDFLNGIEVSKSIFNFIRWYCLTDDTTFLDMSSGSLIMNIGNSRFEKDKDLFNRKAILQNMSDVISNFNPDYITLLCSLLAEDQWLNSAFGLSGSDE